MSKPVQTVGAETARARVTERVRKKRAEKNTQSNWEPPPTTVQERAVALLKGHGIEVNPANVLVAQTAVRCDDAAEYLYDQCLVRSIETRQISAMVSAGKSAIAALASLGIEPDGTGTLGFDDLEEPVPKKRKPRKTRKSKTKREPDSDPEIDALL